MKGINLPPVFYSKMCDRCKKSPDICGEEPEECAKDLKYHKVYQIINSPDKAREQE
jgi:hypothetical protein